MSNSVYIFINIFFFGVPQLAAFIFVIIVYVIAYIHPV